MYLSFLVGAVVTTILTNVGKYTTGKLRPHFLAVCKPDFSKLNCTTGFQKNFITNYECTGDKHKINEARLSFPSGHASHAGNLFRLLKPFPCISTLHMYDRFKFILFQMTVLAFGY